MYKIDKISDSITIGSLDLAVFSKKENIRKKRDVEKAGTRFLLEQLFNKKTIRLEYTVNNKPYLKAEHCHISISHSHDKLVIIINPRENTGIDIELIRDKVKNIQNKFLNAEELNFAKDNTEALIKLWAAKEAIYKAYGLKELDFKENIFIDKFEKIEENFYGKISLENFKKKYLLSCRKIENYILVYILNEV
jgi:4'-phosphopantetheinyl transferase